MFELVAEVKPKSPFGYESDRGWDQLLEIAVEHGDAISVHTNPLWGGSFDLVRQARARTKKPILAKGIHRTDRHVEVALNAGATNVLVVGRMPRSDLRPYCWIEPMSLSQMGKMGLTHLDVVVWNSRDLGSGHLKPESFDQARELHDGWLVQASNIGGIADVRPGANAVIVGEHLEQFVAELQTI